MDPGNNQANNNNNEAEIRFRGVRKRKSNRYYAEIRDPKKKQRLSLGTFDTAKLAALAYDNAARQFYGEKATLNFPALAATAPPAQAVQNNNLAHVAASAVVVQSSSQSSTIESRDLAVDQGLSNDAAVVGAAVPVQNLRMESGQELADLDNQIIADLDNHIKHVDDSEPSGSDKAVVDDAHMRRELSFDLNMPAPEED